MRRTDTHGRASSAPMDGIKPAGLRRGAALAVLRGAGEDGVELEAFRAAFGPDADRVIEELRARGHCIQTQRPSPGRVILHESRRRAA